MGMQRTDEMQRMDFETLVQTRKSVRGFTNEPVARTVIEDVIEVAKRAPSSMNTQPWHIRPASRWRNCAAATWRR